MPKSHTLAEMAEEIIKELGVLDARHLAHEIYTRADQLEKQVAKALEQDLKNLKQNRKNSP